MLKVKWRKLGKPGLMLFVAMMSTGCQTTTPIEGTECQAFQIITYSSKDTPETVRQVIGHNGAYEALCGGKR